MSLAVTSLYASIVALLFVGLSARVIFYRRGHRISVGDAGDKALLQRMRAQANAAEYMPIALILLALTEANGAPPLAVHGLGLMLIAGRILHPLGFAVTPQKIILRQIGMLLTHPTQCRDRGLVETDPQELIHQQGVLGDMHAQPHHGEQVGGAGLGVAPLGRRDGVRTEETADPKEPAQMRHQDIPKPFATWLAKESSRLFVAALGEQLQVRAVVGMPHLKPQPGHRRRLA